VSGEVTAIGLFIGELAAAIVVGLYAIGDADGWGRDRRAIARRVLVCVHALGAFFGIEILLSQALVEPGWLVTALRAANVLVFPVLALALVKGFPDRLRAMLEVTFGPLLYGGLIALSARLLSGRDLAGLLQGRWLREELLLFSMPYFVAAAAALTLLLVDRLTEGSVGVADGLREAWLTVRDETFFSLFWILLLATWWTQAGLAGFQLVAGLADEPWHEVAVCCAGLTVACWRLVTVMRRAIPEGT